VSSLVAALLGQERASAREGWVGEMSDRLNILYEGIDRLLKMACRCVLGRPLRLNVISDV
jgi:hypothetical protein